MSSVCVWGGVSGCGAELRRGAEWDSEGFTLRCCFCLNLCYLPLSLTYFTNGFWLSGLFFSSQQGSCMYIVCYLFLERSWKVLYVLAIRTLSTCMKRVWEGGQNVSVWLIFTLVSLQDSPAFPSNFVPNFSGGCKAIFELICLLQFAFSNINKEIFLKPRRLE